MVQRLEKEAEPGERAKLLSATYVLTGLRVSREIADQLFQGVHAMKESSTYQAILEEGAAEALQKTLLRQGKQRFGAAAPAEVENAIRGVNELERLERMTDRLLIVPDWQELLETP